MLSLLWLSGSLWLQLSGTYWINGTSQSAARSFATLQEALDTLARAGAQGTVWLRITYPYDPTREPSTIRVKAYTCQSCSVVVAVDTPITIARRPRAGWQEGQYVLRIQGGVQHFTLNGRGRLTLKSLTDTTEMTGVVGLVPRSGPVSHIRLDSCRLEGHSRQGTQVAFYIGDSASATLVPVWTQVRHITLHACTLQAARYLAVALAPGWGNISHLRLENCVLGYPTAQWSEAAYAWGGSPRAAAFYSRWVEHLTLAGCLIQGAWETQHTVQGVHLEFCYMVTLRANRIRNLRSFSTEGHGAVGLRLLTYVQAGPTQHLVENNFIGNLVGSADESLPGSSEYLVAGIVLEGNAPTTAPHFSVRHNTIHLYGQAEADAPWAKDGFSAGIVIGKNLLGGVEIAGNLIQNTLRLRSLQPLEAKESCGLAFWEPSTAIAWSSMNLRHNFYYVRGERLERSYIARVGWGDNKRVFGTLAAWQAFSGLESGSREGVSHSAPFVNPAEPILEAGQPWEGINAGPVPAIVNTDLYGTLRPQGSGLDPGTAPDIGAYELDGTPFPCSPPATQALSASAAEGLVSETLTIHCANPSALSGRLSLLWSLDGGPTWHARTVRPTDFPLSFPLPAPTQLPGLVELRLVAAPLPGCPGAPDTSPPLAILVRDRPGNRPSNAIPLQLTAVAPGVWEATYTDSLLGLGLTDEFSQLPASRSRDLFFTFTLPDCLDSLDIDLCDEFTDFDTRLHLLSGLDTLSDRDQGNRGDCRGYQSRGGLTSRIIMQAADAVQSPSDENFSQPQRGAMPLTPNQRFHIAVEGEEALEVGHFRLRLRGYNLPPEPPNLGPDREVCLGPQGIRLSGFAPGARHYEWFVNGERLNGAQDSFIVFSRPPGRYEVVVVAHWVPLQACDAPASARDTLNLQLLPALQAALRHEGRRFDNGDTLYLRFGLHTFYGETPAADPVYTWRLYDRRGTLLEVQRGPSYSRAWEVSGVFMVQLTTEAGGCREEDTLYLEVSAAASLSDLGASAPALWPNPTQGTLWLYLPTPGSTLYRLFNSTGQCLKEGLLEGGKVASLTLPFPPGYYRLQILTAQTAFSLPFLIVD
ncbi:MAG: hypothetical protein ABDH91_02485 [Bacteroidia bacterium]